MMMTQFFFKKSPNNLLPLEWTYIVHNTLEFLVPQATHTMMQSDNFKESQYNPTFTLAIISMMPTFLDQRLFLISVYPQRTPTSLVNQS